MGTPRMTNAHELNAAAPWNLVAKMWSARAGVVSRNRASGDVNRLAYRMIPVEKTSIPPRVKNIRSNRLATIAPLNGMLLTASSRNRYQLTPNVNVATNRLVSIRVTTRTRLV